MGTTFSKPHPYTSDPSILLLNEFWLFVVCSFPTPWNALGLPSIVWPLMGWGSRHYDEIYPWSWGNAWAILSHLVLFIFQLIFLIGVPTSAFVGVPLPLLLYAPALIISIVGFYIVNKMLCTVLLNGRHGRTFYSAGPRGEFAVDINDTKKMLISRDPRHAGERWVFINGVAVGSHWLQSNLDRLAATFRRPILGIHNDTYGIPFDVLECMIQRTFGYATLDIRTAYAEISQMLADEKVSKLVLVTHSQGCIEGGMVLDWLYATISTQEIQKLEVYTFGNASNHWNNPMRLKAPAIKHMEHYANRWDWVSRFGILHFRPPALKSAAEQPAPVTNGATDNAGSRAGVGRSSTAFLEAKLAAHHRFVGRLFIRDASGHQCNQHYLDNFFPMSWRNGGLDRVVDSPRSFMNQDLDEQALVDDDVVKPVSPGGTTAGRKIKELSRLWKYVNGGVPARDEESDLAEQVASPVAIRSAGPLSSLARRR